MTEPPCNHSKDAKVIVSSDDIMASVHHSHAWPQSQWERAYEELGRAAGREQWTGQSTLKMHMPGSPHRLGAPEGDEPVVRSAER